MHATLNLTETREAGRLFHAVFENVSGTLTMDGAVPFLSALK
ncbi:hypothetical protein PSP6_320129 [Paraburkholderia tropica]|nr:hypothetical protein PSP6_320129 [Paraburkholderia tropica]